MNALLDHLVLIDREQQVVEFVTQNEELHVIETKNIRKFYSKLVRKLIASEMVDETVQLLRHCVTKEVNGLEEELVSMVNKSRLKEKDK